MFAGALLGRVAIVVTALTLVANPAHADWRVARHDTARTGASSATSDITTPAVYWRAYLGGTLGPTDMIAADLNGDGKIAIVFVSGGRLVAQTPEGLSIWEAPLIGVKKLFQVRDVNGDGTNDVLIGTSDHVYILSARTGAVEWVEPDGEMGTLGDVRVGDFDGDGVFDLLIQECGCCGISSGNAGYVYSFRSGFSSPKQLWTLPSVYCGTTGTTVFDPLGDGTLQVAMPTLTNMRVLSGKTGALLATSNRLGTRMDFSSCRPVDVDGIPGEELVCVQNVNIGPNSGGRQVFVLKYSAQPQPSVATLWQQPVGDFDGGDLSIKPDFVVDLQGNGRLQIVLSGKSATGTWTTYAFDAKTGNEVSSLINQQVAGTAALEATSRLLLTYDETDGNLAGWVLRPSSPPSFELRWTLPDRATLTYPDRDMARRCALSDALLATDLDGDQLPDLIAEPISVASQLTAYTAAKGSPVPLGTYSAKAGAQIIAGWILPPTTQSYLEPAVVTSDGFLSVLDRKLLVGNASVTGDPGIRTGGYYSGGAGSIGRAPIVGRTDGSAAEGLLVVDSRGSLIRLDASTASLVSPPSTSWQRPNSSAVTIVPGLDQPNTGLFCVSRQVPTSVPPKFEVAALKGDGSTLWEAPLEAPSSFDVLPGNLDGDGVPDVVVQITDASNLVHTRGLAGRTGATLFNASPVSINSGLQPFAVADWNHDGTDDVVTVLNSIRALSGVDGSQLVDGNTFLAYFLPTVLDVDNDGLAEVTLHGGVFPARTLKQDMVTSLWIGEDDKPNPFGAVVECPSGYVLVEGSTKNPARLKITQVAGSSAGTSRMLVLASGSGYADEQAAKTAGAVLGALGNVNVESNLSGSGHPTAVVGSDDGWLYGVNACTGSVDFSLQLGSAVGEPVFGDTDGDGKDEILVSAADGYLYGIKNMATTPPAFVWDTDVPSGITDRDVNDITTHSTLYCKWGTVPQASGYEVAALHAGGGFVTAPAWIEVSSAITETTLSGLSLSDGAKYFCAVRAVTSGGRSVDASSNGVVVHFIADASTMGGGGSSSTGGTSDAGPTPDYSINGRACTCSTDGHGGGRFAGIGALVVVLGWGRRRRRRQPPRQTVG